MEQALGAIQEAEVIDQTNPEVWVQVRLLLLFTRFRMIQPD